MDFIKYLFIIFSTPWLAHRTSCILSYMLKPVKSNLCTQMSLAVSLSTRTCSTYLAYSLKDQLSLPSCDQLPVVPHQTCGFLPISPVLYWILSDWVCCVLCQSTWLIATTFLNHSPRPRDSQAVSPLPYCMLCVSQQCTGTPQSAFLRMQFLLLNQQGIDCQNLHSSNSEV